MGTITRRNTPIGAEMSREGLPETGTLRSRDFVRRGISRQQVKRMLQRGEVERLGRGIYRLPATEWTRHHALAEVALRVPHGIVCLTSALAFHNLTTQIPSQVYLLIERTARPPRTASPAVRLFRATGEALHVGVETREIEGVAVRITNLPRTVADCFKYRNKIGLDIALEALKESLRRDPRTGRSACTRDDLYSYARLLRVHNVIRPYLEALSV